MKKILIIGAGFLQSFVIQKAKSLGYIVLAVDADPNAIGFQYADGFEVVNIVDEEACLSYAKKENIDGVLTAATDYGVLTAAYIAQEMNLPGLEYEVAKLIKNKYLVRKRLFEQHVDDTQQAYEVDGTTDIEKLGQELVFPVMVKPCDGSGSRGASRVDKPEDLKSACQYAMAGSITHRAEIESFIVGREYGVESLVADGEVHVLGIMQKWMTDPPYYAELGHAIPSSLSDDLEEKIKACVKKAIIALGINFGSVNMDLLVTDSGNVHIVDIGARMGGNMIGSSIIPYGTGIDYMANMIRNAAGDPVVLEVAKKCAVATRLLAFKTGGVITKLPDFDTLASEYGVEIFHHLEIDQQINDYHTNLDGCGYIIARAENVEKAVVTAEKVLSIIRGQIFEQQEDAIVASLLESKTKKHGYRGVYQLLIKRVIDIILCLLALPFVLLFTIPIAAIIKLEDNGPIFYRSRRLGKGFKEFDMLKFRSMRQNAPDLRNEDGSTYNSKTDARVTKIGRILRETSLDEIPQIFNVLLGDMSIIGPRAGDVESKDTYEEDEKDKMLVRPGISGYTQAYYRNNLGVREKRLYDAWYAYNVSLALDIKILCKTVATVLKRENVYTNEDITKST